jgi:hypothetical protein
LSLLGPMQGWRVWVALAEPGDSYRSQPCLLRWFQARGAAEKAAKLWGAITVDPEGLKTLLLALVGIWLCGAGRQLNLVHFRAICYKFVYCWQRFPTTTRVPKNESILDHFWGLFVNKFVYCWPMYALTKVRFDKGLLWWRSTSTSFMEK